MPIERVLYAVLPIIIGFALDQILGDPQWMPHPVRLMGKVIAGFEGALRRLFPEEPRALRAAGYLLAGTVPLLFAAGSAVLIYLCGRVATALACAVECIMCYQLLALKDLREESLAVVTALEREGIEAARTAVGCIVGRDTAALDEEGVLRAAVETVAENSSDGVIAPLFYMGMLGAPLAFFYKAVNTLDSMVAYKNERYLHFGRGAAKLDDAVNFLPSRLAALLLVAAAKLLGADAAGAWRIFRRDRFAHASPNSAQTEAAVAGALGLRLAGGASYFGKWMEKPYIGDETRPIVREDVARSGKLAACAGALMLPLAVGMRIFVLWAVGI